MKKNKLFKKLRSLERKKVFYLTLTWINYFAVSIFFCLSSLDKNYFFVCFLMGASFLVIAFICYWTVREIQFKEEEIKENLIKKASKSLYYEYCSSLTEIIRMEKKIMVEIDQDFWKNRILFIILASVCFFSFHLLVKKLKINIFTSYLIVAIFFSLPWIIFNFNSRQSKLKQKKRRIENYTKQIYKLSQKREWAIKKGCLIEEIDIKSGEKNQK